MTPKERDTVMAGVVERTIKKAKEMPPEDRGLLDTLLASDIPFDRAVSLVADESARGARSVLAQYADTIRSDWVPAHSEGSEVRLRLAAVADMLDPETVIGAESDS